MPALRSIADLPAPRGLPGLGNLHQIRPATAHLTLEAWCERHGPIYRMAVGPIKLVVIGDLDAINAILRDRPEGFRRTKQLAAITDEMGAAGVFSAEGEDWRRQRRLAVLALNSNHLQRYFHIIHTATGRLHRRFATLAAGEASLDIAQELTSFSVDVISALAFGHDLNTLERRDNELQGHIQRMFDMAGRRLNAPFPYWRRVRLRRDRALDRSLKLLHGAVAQFIAQARERMAARPELRDAPENFLEGILAQGTFSDAEISGNVLTLLNAGEDTTAHTLAWTLWFLSTRPEIQERLAAEARAVLGEDAFPPDYDSVARLPYTEAVLRESMRLKPVAAVNNAEPLADTTVAGIAIPKGTLLVLLQRYAGLHDSGVERPLEFDPERWLSDGESVPDPKSFLAFGAGPRFCPGRNLALLETKTALAMIARNFTVELDASGGPVTEQMSFTVIPRGLRVRLRARSPAPALSATPTAG
jgi:cytochrome P450